MFNVITVSEIWLGIDEECTMEVEMCSTGSKEKEEELFYTWMQLNMHQNEICGTVQSITAEIHGLKKTPK